jgi:hypothetical protein
MPWLSLLNLKDVDWKRLYGIGASLVVVVLLYLNRQQAMTLKQAEVAYAHPKVKERVRYVQQKGQVIYRTKIVEVPGHKETTTEEIHAPVIITTDDFKLSEPVVVQAVNENRWILGVGVMGIRPVDKAFVMHGGWSFKNRLDFRAGIDTKARPSADVSIRF